MSSRAVFLDREKTILLPKGGEKYIYRVEDFNIPDKFIEALKKLIDHEYLLFVITNQGRIARVHLTEDDVEELNECLDSILKQNGVHISEFEYCTHNHCTHNQRGTLHPYNIICECRKPKTGMIDSIRNSYEIDVSNA